MSHRFILFVSIVLWGAIALPKAAQADTVLTRAEIKSLRNLVQLMPQSQTTRPAKVADGIVPGDALSTGREALAELRFNDGSLARIGEQALFRFSAQNRNLKLSNGTALLLIPPGRGTTEVWTPNATAAIRGSALFIRHVADSKTTVFGALTNSQIEVVNQKKSQRQVLKAGQLAVVIKGKITALYNFDLKTFYESSDLVSGLNLNKKNATATDIELAQVQAETIAAVAAQSPLTGEEIIINPSFIRSSESPSSPLHQNSNNSLINTSDSTTEFIDNGAVILDRFEISPDNSESSSDRDSMPIGDRDDSTKDEDRHPDKDNNGIGDGNGGGRDRHPDKDNNGIGDGNGGGRINNPDKNDKSRK
ncbi:FecR family protein [Scytonema millei]|uniref:FecR domain-containing protein n=1 Tax=Scytonema millei VB511283 TaxID=1245923 RepID=A0A9X5E500_9CYAN|nr:FecR family protein [Scytonema millei]NHC35410.1 FecR domain-containing protein [Scytonema millei VB511283]